MVLTAAAICTALTESDWPNAMRSCDLAGSTGSPVGRMPGGLAAHADVGALAEAELRAGRRAARPGANLSAASTVPMLEDLAMTPARVRWISAVGEPVVDDAVLRGPARRAPELGCAG